ncbi:Na+/H+ antiporter NhaA [Phenylobacterium deserti]|uniref:Na(+)/H(+) antiporter NhaA n=1 Tax=Phenylobacterium deserti TaxID=1914756 RepID=A0A328ASV8_9CAUL|nr:Na+/H+ antiporter NhaA [Phenylobacterium deserti]RAK56594.1 Na+/H+ antiporter NhaA [Phenylobacterium deserti]
MARRITLDFLRTESASGVVLAAAALAAVAMANSPLAPRYFEFIGAPFTVQFGAFHETRSVLAWVRDGLMAIFFFVLGLEVKHEALRGELANPRRLALPIAAALGGLLAPAVIYLLLNTGSGPALAGWPATTGTDMAIAMAALALAGPRTPPALRTFLLTIAILQNLGAVAISGVLAGDPVSLPALGGGATALALMFLMGRWRRAPYLFYGLGFILVWAFALKAGLSTALAGIAAAMAVPIEPRKPHRPGVTEDFVEGLHPYVAYFVLPLFAFTAAGVSFRELAVSNVASPVALGTALALAVGKPLGIFGACALLIALKKARRPTGAGWADILGVSLLCGAGFTLSLYLGQLALEASPAQAQMRLGVVAGSVISTLAGLAVLGWARARRLRPA